MLWYSLEAPWQGASNEYPQHMFLWRNKKNIMWIPPLICSYDPSCNRKAVGLKSGLVVPKTLKMVLAALSL